MANTMLRAELRKVRGLRDQFENCLGGDDGARWQAEGKRFLRREPCWVPKKPKARTFAVNIAPFDLATFMGAGWSTWRGPATGDGLEGEEAQDPRSLTLSEFDMNSIRFENMLNEEDGEVSIKGEEKILRLKAAKFVRLDPRLGRDLLGEPNQETLEWLYRERGITWFDLPGKILRDPDGNRVVLYLYRYGREWYWGAYWLEGDWNRSNPSAVL